MKYFIYILFIFGFITSCSEETIVSEISGKIYRSCDNSPYSYGELALKANQGGSFNDPIILGGDVSNGDGYFQFTYELEESESGSAELILANSNGYTVLLENLDVNRDLELSLYTENISEILVNLSGTKMYQSTDTLMIGVSNSEVTSSYIQPVNGVLGSLKVTVPNAYNSANSRTLFYGIGEADFQKAKEALTTPTTPYQHVLLSLEGCSTQENVDLVIN